MTGRSLFTKVEDPVSELLDLARQLEDAPASNPSFRNKIYEALGLNFFFTFDDPTLSLDTAAKLVPTGMVWIVTSCGMNGEGGPDMNRASALVSHPRDRGTNLGKAEGVTPAMALTAALIRAIAGSGDIQARQARAWSLDEHARNPMLEAANVG